VGALTACEEELSSPVTASLPRAFGEPMDPQIRLALVPLEARALLVGSRLLGRPLPALLMLAAESVSNMNRVQRWARPYAEPRGMLIVPVHLPSLALAQSQVAAARFGLRCETYLVARAFELLRDRALAEPTRWAFVGLPAVQQPDWLPVAGDSLQLA